jgi:chemotaxis signal transduction protein
MARDDILEKELSELEKEIEAKVDSLFVEMDEEASSAQAQEDPWKRLKELFLTLEWEIEESTLLKICAEVEHLQSQFPEGALGTLLGWIGETAKKISEQGAEVDQEAIQLLTDLKDSLFQVAEDPFGDPQPILAPLRPRMERFLVGEVEEAPTITLEAAGGEELLMKDLDRTVEEVFGPEEEEEQFLLETEPGPSESPAASIQDERAVQETMEEAVQLKSEPSEQIDMVKTALTDCGEKLQGVLKELSSQDPFGMRSAFEAMAQRLGEMASSLETVVNSLREQVQTLWSLDLVPKPPEPQALEGNLEEILFVSVSNRVFGIPMSCVMGVFRVPSRSVSQVVQMSEVTLRDKTVPLVSLWKKLGLGRALYTFPKEEKRIILVASGNGEVGLLVDQVLARQEILVRPVEEDQRPLFKGFVSVEKNALVVDLEAL